MDREDRRALVALSLVSGLGPGRIRKLINDLGPPSKVLEKTAPDLIRVPGIGPQVALRVSSFDDFELVDAQFQAAEQIGARLLCDDEDEYPPLLREIYDPPSFLWIRGRFQVIDRQAIAIVGTRKATSYGRHIAGRLAAGLSELGFTIVSGLAYGIDTAAHRGALEAGGRSVAILGSGVDKIYPGSNRALAMKMVEHGCLLSEYELGAKPDAPNFPRRNRIISGMTLGTVIVEAFEEGGALITARLACEQNREVFAVPSPVSRENGPGSGCNRLIQRGHAKLVMSVDDIVTEFPDLFFTPESSGSSERTPDSLSTEEHRLWNVLEYQPADLDTICSKSELDPSTALVHLLSLEFKGLVRQLAGKQFVRN